MPNPRATPSLSPSLYLCVPRTQRLTRTRARARAHHHHHHHHHINSTNTHTHSLISPLSHSLSLCVFCWSLPPLHTHTLSLSLARAHFKPWLASRRTVRVRARRRLPCSTSKTRLASEHRCRRVWRRRLVRRQRPTSTLATRRSGWTLKSRRSCSSGETRGRSGRNPSPLQLEV